MAILERSKLLVHAALRRFGYRLIPIAMSSEDEGLRAALTEHRIDLILDVGANTGQFARHVLGLGYGGRIVSFEPQSAAHAALLAESRANPRWEVAERCCLGDRDGEVEIHLSRNSISSSVLPIVEESVDIDPEARYVGVEKVPMHRLDTVSSRHLAGSRATLLKIDVQGYEQQVLDGASQTIVGLRGLLVEMSLRPVYEGQTLFIPMLEWITNFGFEPYRFTPAFMDPRSGRWLQVDGLFFRAA